LSLNLNSYQKYFYNTLTDPLLSSPELDVDPEGTGNLLNPYPITFGANDLLFHLDSIHYTSKYGGSVQLVFYMFEDFEYEFRFNDKLWDVNNIVMSIYVTPSPSVFNLGFIPPSAYFEEIHVEFSDVEAIPYDISPRRISLDTDPDEIIQHLDEYANNRLNLSNLSSDANRFVLGYLHVLFEDEIGSSETVDSVSIGDNRFELRTSDPDTYFFIQYRINDFVIEPAELGSELGNEIKVLMTGRQLFSGTEIIIPSKSWPLTGTLNKFVGPSTGWYWLGMWKAEGDCAGLEGVAVDTLIEFPNSPNIASIALRHDYDGIQTENNFGSNLCYSINSAGNSGDTGLRWETTFLVDTTTFETVDEITQVLPDALVPDSVFRSQFQLHIVEV